MFAATFFRASFRQLTAALSLLVAGTATATAAPATFYPQAQPSTQEQYLLELINRARANPAAEGAMLASVTDPEILRYYKAYGVLSTALRNDFSSYKAQPPLALNPQLMGSSRTQSLDQATHGFQGHVGSDGSTLVERVVASGYQGSFAGENVYTFVENPFFGHVGMNSDWGVPDLGHRANIMNFDPTYPVYKEVGISCVPTSIANMGPLVVTEDFASPRDASTAYVVGVVYNDANGNGSYDEGEGLGGVNVTPDQGNYYTTTNASGGFCLPLPAGVSAGSLTVTVSGGSLGAPRVKTISFVAGTNVKLDFTTADAAGAPITQVAVKAVNRVASPDGSQVGMVTVSRTGASLDNDLNVALAVGGSAVSGVDYSALPASITIPAGQSVATIQVQALATTSSTVKKVKFRVTPGSDYQPASSGSVKVKILP